MRKGIFAASCLVVFVAVLFAAEEVQVQPLNVKPGMWQVQAEVKYSGLPPQYQAMMEQQKAATKICVKAKDLNKPWSVGDSCRWTVLKSTGDDLNAHGNACQHGSYAAGSDLDMDINVHALDSEHVRATLHGTGNLQGNKITVDGNYTGKWLGSTCSANSK